jgi:hypothetical protein
VVKKLFLKLPVPISSHHEAHEGHEGFGYF